MKKFTPITLACLLLLTILCGLALTSCSGKQVPVYQGMTVSKTAPIVNNGDANVALPRQTPDLGIALLSSSNQPDHFGSNGSKLKVKYKKVHGSSLAIGETEQLFYTAPNEDVYITVYVSNPAKYEILSFTLNGTKYSSYMFETGSDLEHLILKCNVGDAEGIVEYTIDAIKYVDGTTIKDVKMAGDTTVKIGSYTENQPTANIQSVIPGFNSVSFTATATDSFGLIDICKGKLYAVVYDGEDILLRKEITADEAHNVSFSKLSAGTEYQCAVVGEYDSLNGEGMNVYILAEQIFTTPSIVAFSNVKIGDTTLNFTLDWAKEFNGNKKLKDLSLYSNDTLISKLNTSATEITDLLSNHSYRLVATFDNQGSSETSTLEFTTKTNAVPTFQVVRTGWSPTSISFDLDIDDQDNTAKVTKIELLDQEGNLLKTLDTSARTVDSLEPTFFYTVRATFTYDLRDGEGSKTVVGTAKIATQSSGLRMEGDNLITGLGTCKDSTVYIAYPVAYEAFQNNNTIKHLVFGPGVTSLGGWAFNSCANLETVYFHEGLKILEDSYIFGNCPLLKSVHLPNSLTSTYVTPNISAASLFHNCTSLQEVHLPENLKNLPNHCFKNCKSLTEIYIPDSVTEIRQNVFQDCTALKTVHLPVGLTKINNYTFDNCQALTTINMPKGITEIGPLAFRGCSSLETIHIPTLVTTISDDAFSNCSSLKTVSLPDSIVKIGNRAFQNCKSIKTINLSKNITEIGSQAFYGCSSLETVELPPLVTIISNNTFADCTALKTITLPDRLTEIGGGAFSGCQSLTSIDLPQSLITIGSSAFHGCQSLTSIDLPQNLLTIGNMAFWHCYSLKEMYIPKSVVNIKENAFGANSSLEYICCLSPESNVVCGNDWNGDKPVIWDFKEFSSDSQGIQYAVMNSGKMVVLGYNGTQGKITIPKGVIRIERNAFSEFSRLSSVILPEGLESIGKSAFYHCNLTEIVIPSGVKIIEESAFEGCPLESIQFPDSLTTIGYRAFKLCNLKTLKLPPNITSIGESAFATNEFESVTIPGSIKTIATKVFENCRNLKKITICEGVTEIDTQAFCMCNSLETIVLPNGFITINDGAFEGTSLKSITIPNTVTNIGSGVFYGNYRLEEIIYLGTKAEWNEISKKNNWSSECYLSVIHCTDGDIIFS